MHVKSDMIIQVAPVWQVAEIRVVRLFVSSTFRDMHAERDELTKFVFPELRKRCNQRGVEFSAVDLRWGVTPEQIQERKLLPICLAEIDRCYPYFLGILGQYYGHVVAEIEAEVALRFPWLEDCNGCSITELEILHAVLRNPKPAGHGVFFFRKECLDNVDDKQRATWRSSGPLATKLATLKERIRAAGFSCTEYESPQDLRNLAQEQLWALIDAHYPQRAAPDKVALDRLEHEAFAVRHRKVYVKARASFDEINAHALGNGPPLVLCGGSGTGKSALLANWLQMWHRENPNIPTVGHFVGATKNAHDPAEMLRRLMAEIGESVGVDFSVSDSTRDLSQAFTDLLLLVSKRCRVILMIDGISELQQNEQVPALAWLPPEVPEGIRLILSTRPGPLVTELERRHFRVMKMEDLSRDERDLLIREYLARQGRTLTDRSLQCISSAPQAASPLFLRTVLDELCVFGIYEELGNRIDYYLQAKTVENLYQKVLARWEADYERETAGLVRDTMTLLWASRSGLPESDLMWLLRQGDEPMPARHWSPFSLAAEEVLAHTSGGLRLANEHIFHSVQSSYINFKTAQAARQKISDYYSFWSRNSHTFALSDKYRQFVDSFSRVLIEKDRKQVEELPWLYVQLENWDALFSVLCDIEFLLAVSTASHTDGQKYWELLTKNGYAIQDAYRDCISHPEKYEVEELRVVVDLLIHLGRSSDGLAILVHLTERFRQEGNSRELGLAFLVRANILQSRGDFENALRFLTEAESVFSQHGDRLEAAIAINDLGIVLANKGDIDAAKRNFDRARRAFESERALRLLGMVLNNLGSALATQGEVVEAMKHLKRAEAIHRRVGTDIDLAKAMRNQGLVSMFRGDADNAVERLRQACVLFERSGHREGVADCRDLKELLTANLDIIRDYARKHLNQR